MRQLDTPCGEKGVGADEEGIRPLTLHTFESSTDLTAGVGVENLDLQTHGASSSFYLGRTGRINEHRDTHGLGQQLAQEFQPLRRQRGREETDTVRFPPGRARQATRPTLTGSSPVMKTMGIVDVAALAASIEGIPAGVITAT